MSKTTAVLLTLGITLAIALGGTALAVALTRSPTVTVQYPNTGAGGDPYFGSP